MQKSKIVLKIGKILIVIIGVLGIIMEIGIIREVKGEEKAASEAGVPIVIAEDDNEREEGLKVILTKQDVGSWNGFNSVRKAVRMAVERGVAPKTIVLLLMLPLVATLVSFLHYVFGLSGYGIFMPTMLSVTMLTTGIAGGLVLFAMILLISLLSGLVLKRLKMHFWPARSINLLLISLGTFGLMLVSPIFSFINLSDISIFPVLLMIILAEEFVRTQLTKSKKEAVNLTLGTLVLSIVGAFLMKIEQIQRVVILNPEVMILIVLIVNILVGSYSGIRVAEIARFRKAIRVKR